MKFVPKYYRPLEQIMAGDAYEMYFVSAATRLGRLRRFVGLSKESASLVLWCNSRPPSYVGSFTLLIS